MSAPDLRAGEARAELIDRHEALGLVLHSQPVCTASLPVRLDSVANGSQGTTRAGRFARARKTKKQREVLTYLGQRIKTALEHRCITPSVDTWLAVRLVRVAPRSLDDDNLARCLKPARDAIAEVLGVDDRNPAVRYVPNQRKGAPRQYAVEVEVYYAGGAR